MDRKLLDLLCSPDTRQPLALLEARGLDALNRAIAAGQVLRGDGSAQAQPLREALVSRDRKQVFRIDDGIPVLLVEEALATAQDADEWSQSKSALARVYASQVLAQASGLADGVVEGAGDLEAVGAAALGA